MNIQRMRPVFLLVLILVISVVLSACSPGVTPKISSASTPTPTPLVKEPATIKFWGSASTQGPGESKMPQEEWLITKILKEYEVLNPHITIEFSMMADQTTVHQTIKASAVAKEGPDIVNLWAGSYVSALNEVLLPINDLMLKSDLEDIIGWNMLTDNLKPPSEGGKILGYPIRGTELGLLMYNKEIVMKSGLDFEANPPKTVEEFMDACAAILKAGYQPIVSSDAGYNGAVSFVFNKWWSQQEGLERLASNGLQTTKFADDKGFLNLFSTLQTIYDKGYLNKDYITKTDPSFDFYNGKAAMYTTGNWDIEAARIELGENLRLLDLPDFSSDVKNPGYVPGGVGQSLCVLNYTKYPQQCVDLIVWLNNRENSIRLGKHLSAFPLRKDVTFKDFGWENDVIYKFAFELSQRTETWHEFAMDPELVNQLYALGSTCITGKMTPADYAAAMDTKAKELLAQ